MNAHQRRKARRAQAREPCVPAVQNGAWVVFVPADLNKEWMSALTGEIGSFYGCNRYQHAAPWPDFDGHDIHDGDVIEHPSGDRGTVVFLAQESDPGDQWRVDYGDGYLSRLCLQIGDKGRAVVAGVPLIRGEIGRIEG